jgi:hypothetical protein
MTIEMLAEESIEPLLVDNPQGEVDRLADQRAAAIWFAVRDCFEMPEIKDIALASVSAWAMACHARAHDWPSPLTFQTIILRSGLSLGLVHPANIGDILR